MKTGLFWFLHRACRVAYWCCWLGLLFFFYRQRAVLAPVCDALELWWNRAPATESAHTRTGQVTRVYAGGGFQWRDEKGVAFNLGLAGLAVPKTGSSTSATERLVASGSMTNQARLIEGAPVEVTLTMSNPQTRTGLGVVRIGPTNVNEHLLAGGWGRLRRDQIRSLPWIEQFRLVQAERRAKRAGQGVWEPGESGGE